MYRLCRWRRGGRTDPARSRRGVRAWFAPLAADSTLDGFRVIRMLRAGYASGPTPAGHVTVADQAAHCAALLDTLGIEHTHIVAHSSGCVIALQLALDRPDLVGSLILSEPPLIACLAAPEDLEFLDTAVGPVIGGAVAAAARGDVAAAFEQFMESSAAPTTEVCCLPPSAP